MKGKTVAIVGAIPVVAGGCFFDYGDLPLFAPQQKRQRAHLIAYQAGRTLHRIQLRFYPIRM